MLDIRVLGQLSAQSAGSAVALGLPGSRRARDLLAYLATHPGQHSRSSLAAQFWPDVREVSARSSLRGALAELRRALGAEGEVLVASRDAVGLDVDRVRTDLGEFRRLCGQRSWRAAVELDRGRLLADVEYDWADWLRADHAVALTEALAALATERAAAGELSEAAALARRRVRLDPLSEAAAVQLVEVLAAAGDRSGAIEAGRALVDRLQRELGVKPSVETGRLLAGLYEAVVPRDAAVEPGVSGPTAPELTEFAAPRLVGRGVQLDQLRELRRRARLHTAVAWGAAGIGKTALVAAAADEARVDGCLVLYGRCDEERIVPFCAWIEALGPAVEDLDVGLARQLVDEGGAQVLQWFPGLVSLSDSPSGAVERAPEGERWRLFEGLTRLLVRLSRRRPVVLILDDLHWADRSTLLLLRHVVRTTQDAAVTVVVTARSGEVDPEAPMHMVLGQLRRDGLLTEIEVPGLTMEQVGELVELHDVRHGHRDLVAALHAETEGNPFFVSEILRNLAATGSAAGSSARNETGFALSAGIRDLLRRRMRRLDPASRQLLGIAAVIGRDFDLATVGMVGGQPASTVLEVLDSATVADLVDEVGVGRFSFTHSLIRAALYEDLSRTRRADLHARVASALEDRMAVGGPAAPAAAEVAHHYLSAQVPAFIDVAVGFSRQAYTEAMSALAYTEAAALMRRTIEAVRSWPAHPGASDDLSGHPAVGSMLLELGEALSRAGDAAAARAAFADAAAVARSQDQPIWLANAALGYAGPSWQGFGTVETDTIELLEEALAGLGDEHSSLRARLSARLAIALYFTHLPARLHDLTEDALAQARRLDDDGALAAVLEARLWAEWRPDRIHERIVIADELIEVARRSGLAEAGMTARRWRVFALMEAGDVTMAWREAALHAAEAARLQLPYELMYVSVFAFTRAVLEGRVDDAVLASTQVGVYGEMRGGADAVQFGGVHALTFAFLNGQLATLPDAVASFAAGYPAIPGWHAARAVTLLTAGRHDEAHTELDQVWPPEEKLPFDAVWLAAMGFCSLAVVLTGDVDRARHLRKLLSPYTGRLVVLGAGGAIWGTTDVYLALLASLVGDTDAAQLHQNRAAHDLTAAGSDLAPLLTALAANTPITEISHSNDTTSGDWSVAER